MIDNPIFVYVEDDPLSRQVMQMLLVRGLGYSRLTILEDSTDFFERVEALSPKPNIFFLDIHMQPLDGFSMLEMLRRHADFRDALVIAATASVMNEEVNKLRTAGFNGVIAKPIIQREFPGILKRILSEQEVWTIK
jgi:two-component system, cell cycle response regulator